MSEEDAGAQSTLALNTKVEEDFVAPLTSLRGSLEILRDFTDLSAAERQRFIETALTGCARLERSISELSRTVYAAGQHPQAASADAARFAERVRFLQDPDILDVSFSGFEFTNSAVVDAFYDYLERQVAATGRRWHILVNYGGCSVWPEAWVAFAHRGKKMNVVFSLGTARYDESAGGDSGSSGTAAPDIFGSREAALRHIKRMQSAAAH